MTLEVNIGGVWKTVSSVEVNVGGVWKTVSNIESNIAGVWKDVPVGTVTLTNASITDSGGAPARATVIVRTDGTLDKREGGTVTQINTSTDWIIPNVAASSSYQAKWDLVSGDAPTEVTAGWTEASWQAISSDLTVGYATGAPGTESGVVRVSIRLGTGATLDTGDYTLSATEV